MWISTKRKAYVAILVVAAGFWGADKFFFGTLGPTAASAATGKPGGKPAPSLVTAAEGPQAKPQPKGDAAKGADLQPGRLAEALGALSANTADAASLFDTTLIEIVETTPLRPLITPVAEPEQEIVLPSLKVSAVMMGAAGGAAIVNKKVVACGETIDGATLVRMQPGEVEFSFSGKMFVVFVQR